VIPFRRWKRSSQGAFLYKWGLLLSKGYSINQGIELLMPQMAYREKNLMDEVQNLLSTGSPLSEIFHKLQLPKNVVHSLTISSTNGNLHQSLMENGMYMKKKAEWGERLNKTLRYPLFLLFITFWIAFIFYHFLYPQFSLLFSSLKINPPFFTTFILSVLANIPFIGLIILLSVFIFGLAVHCFRKRASASIQMDLMMLVPVFHKIIKLLNTHYLSVNLGAMLKSGLSVKDSLNVMEQHMSGGFFREESRRIKNGLLDGRSLPDLLKEKKYYTNELTGLIEFGQAHGKLGYDLVQYGEWLFMELEEKISRWIIRLQPILFALIGGFVLLLFASMLLPMFKLMEGL
jgi:competence protein ComGB